MKNITVRCQEIVHYTVHNPSQTPDGPPGIIESETVRFYVEEAKVSTDRLAQGNFTLILQKEMIGRFQTGKTYSLDFREI
jgi:hypothetical protein